MREVDLTSDYTVSNVKLVDKADIPKSPVSPNRPRTILIWMFMSLFVGVSVALVLDYLDDTIKTPDDLQVRAGVPVLGFVPNMKGKLIKKGGFPYRALVAMTEPASSATEAYRNIRTNLFFSAPAEENKVLTVTSGGPSDGKTTTSCNLALVMAQSGKRVLLIDADMRKPMIHRAMGLGNKVGLSSVLVGACKLDEAVQKPKNNGHVVEHLDILSAGPRSPNPAELLDSQSMRNLLEEARGKYDRVIVDTPPVLFVADASIISAMSDGVVMVLKSARSTRTLVSRTREQLEGVNARIVGGILNDVRVSRWGYYYSSYYYSYYYRYHYDYARSYYGSRKDEVEEAQEGAGKP
jgi:capsular exopolysaccharide synthesis family protein